MTQNISLSSWNFWIVKLGIDFGLVYCFTSVCRWWNLVNCFNNWGCLCLFFARSLIEFRMPFKSLAAKIPNIKTANARDKNDPK